MPSPIRRDKIIVVQGGNRPVAESLCSCSANRSLIELLWPSSDASILIYLLLTAVVVAIIAGWLLNLFSMPGNWLIVGSLALFAWVVRHDPSWHVGWGLVGVEVVLAMVAEGLELVAGAAGAAKLGGSKRGAMLSVVGSVTGAIMGAGVGLPLPVIGPVAGVVLGAAVGALAGAMLGEAWKGRTLGEGWEIGQAAFRGRLLGTLAKLAISSAMVVIALSAIVASFF